MSSQRITVGMMLFPNLTQLDVTGPYEVFARMPNTSIYLLAASREPVRSERGLTIVPDLPFDEAPALDIVFVPGGAGINPLLEDEAFLDLVRSKAQTARYVTAVCTGSLLLAAAGLLRGYRATTHWLSMDLLGMLGAIPVRERVVVDRNRITCAGITAGIDLGLVVAAEVLGKEIAEEIQLTMEYNPAPPLHCGSPDTAGPAVVQRVVEATKEKQRRRLEIVRRAAGRHDRMDESSGNISQP